MNESRKTAMRVEIRGERIETSGIQYSLAGNGKEKSKSLPKIPPADGLMIGR